MQTKEPCKNWGQKITAIGVNTFANHIDCQPTSVLSTTLCKFTTNNPKWILFNIQAVTLQNAGTSKGGVNTYVSHCREACAEIIVMHVTTFFIIRIYGNDATHSCVKLN